jgi:two-component system nitrogen regulation sensor histidine kinase NtrY
MIKARLNKTRLLVGLILIAIGFFAVATYNGLRRLPPFGNTSPDYVLSLLAVDAILLMCLAMLVFGKVWHIWQQHKQGHMGASLHWRFTRTFVLLSSIPTLLLTLLVVVFFHVGLQAWFSERINVVVSESQVVAKAYLQEHQQNIRADILAMANDLDRAANDLSDNPRALKRFFTTQTNLRNLTYFAQ